MARKKMTQKDIDVLCVHMLVNFKIKKDIDYEVTEDESGYSFNIANANKFDGIVGYLSLMNALFCNFGYTICVSNLSNTHDLEPLSMDRYKTFLNKTKENNQYSVSDKTLENAEFVYKEIINNLNTSEDFLRKFNKEGNIEIYSDANKSVCIELFYRGKRVSIYSIHNTQSIAIFSFDENGNPSFNIDVNSGIDTLIKS